MSQLNVWNFDIFNLDILTGGKCLMLHVAGSATRPALLLNIWPLFDCYAAFQ